MNIILDIIITDKELSNKILTFKYTYTIIIIKECNMSNNFASINKDVSPKEYAQLNEILKDYNMVPDSISKKRSVYKVTVNKTSYCLKKLRHKSKKAVKGMLLVEYLKDRNFNNVVDYIKTKDNKAFIQNKQNIYYLTDWVEGRECNFDDFTELLNALNLMANFHTCSKGFSPDGLEIKSNIRNWPSIFKERRSDLIEFKKLITYKKIRTNFDDLYLKYIDEFLDIIETSILLLEKSHYMDISSKAKKERFLCHDSFYYQNILIDKHNKLHLIDLDSTLYDIWVYDLAKFIRRIMYKKNYAWDFDKANTMIQEYCKINPLSELEYEILLAFIIFPHKFWKLGKKKYYKRKKLDEYRHYKKLNKLIKYVNTQMEFMIKFIDYYNIKL